MARELTGQLVGSTLEELQRKALDEDAIAYYSKAIVGRVAVQHIDPFTGHEETIILKGDITNPKVDEDDYIVPLYTEYTQKFFERANQVLIEQGVIIPYTPENKEKMMINAITDEEIKTALDKKFFAVKALLDRFTSPAPVRRMLRIAKEMDKTHGVITAIERRLAELQQEEFESG